MPLCPSPVALSPAPPASTSVHIQFIFDVINHTYFEIQLFLCSIFLTFLISGAAHIDSADVSESWLSDDQVSDMSAGVNGPITRSEGMYNGYAAIKADWSDTIFMDNFRGADATGTDVAGEQEVTAANPGNTIHTLSGETFY